MRTYLLFLTAVLSSFHSTAQFYEATDLTSENLFTSGIEGPNTDKDGNLFVVNFEKNGTIAWVHENGAVELYVTLPSGSIANAIMFDGKGDFLLADYTGHSILKIDHQTKAISVYCHNDQFNQPNDLCISKKGQLFASDPDWKNGTGKLWRIDPGGHSILLNDKMGTTNGLELSPDETILYVNESAQRRIWAFHVDAAGALSDKRLFFQFQDFGLDGMKCDADGNLYVTRHGKGTVAILSPVGKLMREVQLKGKSVSNITFGGYDGKTCYVTLQDRKCIETFRSQVSGKDRKAPPLVK